MKDFIQRLNAYGASLYAPVTLIVADPAIASIARNAPSPVTGLKVGAAGEISSFDIEDRDSDLSWSGDKLFDEIGDITNAAHHAIGTASSYGFDAVIVNDLSAVTAGDLNDGAVAHLFMQCLEDLSKAYGVRIFAYLPMNKGINPSSRDDGLNIFLNASRRSSAPMIRSARHVLAVFSYGEKIFGAVKSNLSPSANFKSVELKMSHGLPSIMREYA